MSTISRYALVIEPEELAFTPAPLPAPTPTAEADRARAWLASLDLDHMQKDDSSTAEFFKYEVSAGRGEFCHYLFTRSPQQRQHRHSYDQRARGKASDLSEGLERFIREMETKQARRDALKEAKRAARQTFINPHKVGEFLHSSWGYDQTNVEFYQVTAVRDFSLQIREVFQNRDVTNYDQGTCTPRRDEFKGPARWVTIQINQNGYSSIPSPIYGNLYTWDGKPCSWSSYA